MFTLAGVMWCVLQHVRVHPAANLLPQTPSTPVEVRLSLDTFEKAINMLELMHFDAVKAWWEEQQSGEQQQTDAALFQVACAVATCSYPHMYSFHGKPGMSLFMHCIWFLAQ
jgi:hypothetical protein